MLIASILEVFSIISFYSVANLNSEEQFPTSELSCIIYQTNQKSCVIPFGCKSRMRIKNVKLVRN